MIGKTISHYKILEKLGKGGMGVVYKAQDTKLKRIVALKFLPPDLTRDKDAKERFFIEAQAAAALSHTNIVTVHEIDEYEDQIYIATEYVEGQNLKEKIDSGPLAIEESLKIAIQIAEGLQEAHDKGIVHRDIKSANVMIADKGQVKIMDFGLAKLKGQSKLTKDGTTMGTAAYMSPEQAMGKKVNHRTDIWSLGIVLYEMITGQLPFNGDYEQAVVYSILNEKPEPVTGLRTGVPLELERIINKALAKKPEKRYQGMADLLVDLRKVKEESKPEDIVPEKKEKSIIVLPFVNMSADPEQEYFCDGLTDEIIADLSIVHGLRVISRTSAMMLKGSKKAMKTIGKELNVQYVLEGSIRKAGNNLRITAQLIDAVNDAHLWAEKYSGTLDDVFDIQEKVSRSIVDALKVKLTPEENLKIAERPINNVQAYGCYLRARRDMSRLTEEGLGHALRDLQHGFEIIGENELIYVGLAMVYIFYYETGIKADEETLQKAEEFANKVLKLKPNSSHSHYLLGAIERFRGSPLKAIKHFKQALAVDPDCIEALIWLCGSYTFHAGKPSAAEPLIKRLIEIDPLTSLNFLWLGLIQFMGGQLDQAISSFRKMEKLEPESIFPKFWCIYVFAWKSQYDKAFELIDQVINDKSHDIAHKIFAEWSLFFKYALQGEKTRALETISEDVKTYFWNDPELPWLGICNYALINEKEEALNWLEHAIDRGWINYPLFAEKDPFLENIRGEERFKKLMKRVKHEWENFEV